MKRRRLVALGTLWLVLAVGGTAWIASTVPDDIADRTRAALTGSGIEAEVSGRDVTLIGPVDKSVEELTLSIDGVRTVRWRTPALAGDSGSGNAPADTAFADTAPVGTEPPATTPPATTPPATTPPATTPPATTPPATTPADTGSADSIPLVGSFRAGLESGRLTLTGAVPSPEVQAGIAQVADLVYAPLVTDELVVDAGAPAGDWLAGLPRAVAVLPVAGDVAFELRGDTVLITGATGSEQNKAVLEGALRQALGEGFTYDNQVTVTGLLPPSFFADAVGDGTVTLAGVMPDQDSIDLIGGAAVEAFGADNVDNQMSIDDGVTATFSVFRIPFIFAPLALVPQWEINIENDVISGGLRGGASFDYGSAELTPQLQQLATIAAGILSRNPTLGATIEGHTDSDGSAAFNQDLSERRANAARDFIIALGVDPGRLTATGFGEANPISSNLSEAGRAQNRRIEFALGPIEGGG